MKDLKQIIQYIWQYIHSYKKMVFAYIGVGIIFSLIDLVSPFLVGFIIDSAMSQQSVKSIMVCSVIFLVINILFFVVAYFFKNIGQRVIAVTSAELSRKLAQHVQECSLKRAAKTGTAQIIRRTHYSGVMLIAFVENFFFQTVGKVLTGIIAWGVIFSIDPVCSIAVMIEIPMVVILYKAFQSKLLEKERVSAVKEETYMASLYAILTNIRHVKINNIFELLAGRNRKAAQENVDAEVDFVRVSFTYSLLMDNLAVFLQIFLFFYGGIAVIRGKMTIGEFMIIYSYFGMVTGAARYFLDLGKNVQTNKAYYELLKEISDEPVETNGDEMIHHIEKIALEKVSFQYADDMILKDFSCTFERGKIYVVAGENGSGKSTMISLMLGMYIDEFTGDITYNGTAIQKLDMRKIREQKIGVCEQEPYLIDDTIRYNMIYSNQTEHDKELLDLAHQVSLDKFLISSGKGLDTPVGENGDALSGGQKQKTALVKALYKNPDLLVLDEPTSAMDAEGCNRLISYLHEIKKDKIIIVVTHDRKVLEKADEVVYLRKSDGNGRDKSRKEVMQDVTTQPDN